MLPTETRQAIAKPEFVFSAEALAVVARVYENVTKLPNTTNRLISKGLDVANVGRNISRQVVAGLAGVSVWTVRKLISQIKGKRHEIDVIPIGGIDPKADPR